MLDAKAKALGVPVYDAARRTHPARAHPRVLVPLRYLAHRVPPVLRQPDHRPGRGASALGEEVRDKRLHGALKTNIFTDVERSALRSWAPGLRPARGIPSLQRRPDWCSSGIVDVLTAFREGAGDDMGHAARPELQHAHRRGVVRGVAGGRADLGLFWLEYDNDSPQALRYIRDNSPRRQIASLETKIGLSQVRAVLPRAQSVDVAIVDAVWNGTWQSMKIAASAARPTRSTSPRTTSTVTCRR